ncbi:MAG: anthranilate synthase component I, partial [Nitrospinota bacterium]
MEASYCPDLKEFKRLCQKGNLVPVYREIMADLETPVSAFLKIEGGTGSFLLESVEGGEKWARYCFLGAEPSVVFSSKGDRVWVRSEGMVHERRGVRDPLVMLE